MFISFTTAAQNGARDAFLLIVPLTNPPPTEFLFFFKRSIYAVAIPFGVALSAFLVGSVYQVRNLATFADVLRGPGPAPGLVAGNGGQDPPLTVLLLGRSAFS